jgi:hypothetical protein
VSLDTNLSIVALTLYFWLASIYFSVSHPADVVFVVVVAVVITHRVLFLLFLYSCLNIRKDRRLVGQKKEKEGG